MVHLGYGYTLFRILGQYTKFRINMAYTLNRISVRENHNVYRAKQIRHRLSADRWLATIAESSDSLEPKEAPPGLALQHFTSVRADLRRNTTVYTQRGFCDPPSTQRIPRNFLGRPERQRNSANAKAAILFNFMDFTVPCEQWRRTKWCPEEDSNL